MNSSFVFLILAIVFVSALCNDLRSKKAVSFNEVVTTECTAEHMMKLYDAMKTVTCKPYYKLVALKPTPGQIFNPSVVSVRRCDGHSTTGTVCAPTSIRMIQVPVSVFTMASSFENQCTVVNVEEHVSCSLMCQERAADCNAKQEYIEPICKCGCKNRHTRKLECENGSSVKVWDDDDCSCKCKQQIVKRICVTGYVWNSEHCKCMEV